MSAPSPVPKWIAEFEANPLFTKTNSKAKQAAKLLKVTMAYG
jgi:hypothetical protein